MITYSALTSVAGQDAAEALAEALEGLEPAPTGVGVTEIEDGSGLWEVGAYFIERPEGVQLALLAAVHGARAFAVSEIPETDWVAHVRRELSPVAAGRFIVHGSHDAQKVPPGRIGLLIEAAMAFGTGHHGTTLGCLLALDRLLAAREKAGSGAGLGKVADIGCGTAVLGMAAAHFTDLPVLASDIDPVAVAVATANVAANGLAGRVICLESAGFDAPALGAAGPYDLVFANILKGPLIGLAPDMARQVVPGGQVILSGLLNEQAAEVLAVYAGFGFNPVHCDEIVDWTTLTLARAAA